MFTRRSIRNLKCGARASTRSSGVCLRRLPHALQARGALKVSDHGCAARCDGQPILPDVSPFPEDELIARVELIQNRTQKRWRRRHALTDMLDAIKAAKTAGASTENWRRCICSSERRSGAWIS